MVSSWVDGPNILLRNSYVDSTMIPPYPRVGHQFQLELVTEMVAGTYSPPKLISFPQSSLWYFSSPRKVPAYVESYIHKYLWVSPPELSRGFNVPPGLNGRCQTRVYLG